MSQVNPQLPWTEEQWDRVQQTVLDEARRARVAASFLPIVGPLPPDTDFVSKDEVTYGALPAGTPGASAQKIEIKDTETLPLWTLESKIYLRGPQVADPDLTSALQMFRRTANVLARVEDALVFQGRNGTAPKGGVGGVPPVWLVGPDGTLDDGLAEAASKNQAKKSVTDGQSLVTAVSQAIGMLEGAGHVGPFACVLDKEFFLYAQTSDQNSLVQPQERILPFLQGGSLMRSSTLDDKTGLVVALGGAPIDFVVARDFSVSFLQLTLEPRYVFRIHEKGVLRIKEGTAIVGLKA